MPCQLESCPTVSKTKATPKKLQQRSKPSWEDTAFSRYLVFVVLLRKATPTSNFPNFQFPQFPRKWSGRIPYSKTFEGINFWKYNFWRTLSWITSFAAPKDATAQILWRKLSRIATKPRNSQKFLPQSFPLYCSGQAENWAMDLQLVLVTSNCARHISWFHLLCLHSDHSGGNNS